MTFSGSAGAVEGQWL